jgi:hypothetical protein
MSAECTEPYKDHAPALPELNNAGCRRYLIKIKLEYVLRLLGAAGRLVGTVAPTHTLIPPMPPLRTRSSRDTNFAGSGFIILFTRAVPNGCSPRSQGRGRAEAR